MSNASDESPVLDSLARCREEIERIDEDIVALLVRRMDLGKQTGRLKREADLPILDPEREVEVIRRVSELAHAGGLPVDPVCEVFFLIVAMSRRAQEQQ